MMETSARDRAVATLTRLFEWTNVRPPQKDVEAAVDAIVEAARAPELEHSREVRRSIDADDHPRSDAR